MPHGVYVAVADWVENNIPHTHDHHARMDRHDWRVAMGRHYPWIPDAWVEEASVILEIKHFREKR